MTSCDMVTATEYRSQVHFRRLLYTFLVLLGILLTGVSLCVRRIHIMYLAARNFILDIESAYNTLRSYTTRPIGVTDDPNCSFKFE